MRALAIGDPHIRKHAEFSSATATGLTDHLEAVRDSLTWIAELIEHHQPDHVVCLGDVHDSPEGVDVQSMTVAAIGWKLVYDACVAVGARLHFLVGNHDRYNEFVHTLEQYRWLGEDVEVWDDLTLLEWSDSTGAAYRVAMLPWTAELADLTRLPGLPDLAFSHQPLVGATLYGSRQEDRGLDPTQVARHVVQGHYHLPHTYKNVLCPGSLLAKSFSDAEAYDAKLRRGCVLVDLQPSRLTHQFLPNPWTPRFLDFRIPEELDNAMDTVADPRVRARLYFRQEDLELAQAVADSAAGRTRLVPLDTTAEVTRTLPDTVDIEDPVQVVESYGRSSGLDEAQLAAGLDVIREAHKVISGSRCVLRPVALEVRNFFSWAHVKVALPSDGLILIEGDNGAGKTTFMTEAMLWCITGELTPRQDARADTVCRLENPDDPTSGVAKPTEVTLTLRDESGGRDVQLVRRRGGKPDLELLIDGVNIAGHRQAANQQQILDTLRLDHDSLLASVMLVDGFRLAFSRLTPAKRLEIFEQVLRLDVYDKARGIAEKKRDAAKLVRVRLDGVVEGARSAVTRLQERLDERSPTSLPTRRAQAAERHLKASTEVAGQLADARAKQATATADEATHTGALNAARDKSDKLGTKVRELEAHVTDARQVVSARQAEVTAAAVQVATARSKVGEVTRAIERHKELLRVGKCSLCEQPTGASSEQHLVLLNRDLADASAALEARIKEQGQADEAREAALELQQQAESKVSRLKEKLVEAQGDERRAQSALSVAVAARRGAEALVQSLEGGISALQQEVATLDTQIADAQHELGLAQAKVSETMSEAATAASEMARWEWWMAALGPGGLRLNVMGRALNETNERLAELSADMLDYSVALDNDKGSRGRAGLDIQLLGTGKTMAGLSSGQRRSLDFVVQLAISDVAERRSPGVLKLLICDEVLDTLDPSNLGRVVDALDMRSRERLVMMTAHNPTLRALVPTRWRARLDDNKTSQLEQ